MKLLFIADPLASFKPHKDSTFAMMREAQKRGYEIYSTEPQYLHWQQGSAVFAELVNIELTGTLDKDWFRPLSNKQSMALKDFDAVLMRKDPPFDAEYIYASHLLSQAEREGAHIFNSPKALREHPEKLALLEFAEFAPATLVSRQAAHIRAFHQAQQDIILKPLDGMGGMGIYRVKADGLNLGSIIESLTRNGKETIMVQSFLPEITEGDKRILLINGEAVPFCLARIPQGGEVRGNLAAGGKGVARPLSDSDWKIARSLGPTLAARGLLLVGLDVIGNKLTEVNVTSPTCFQEITEQAGFDVAKMFIDALEHLIQK